MHRQESRTFRWHLDPNWEVNEIYSDLLSYSPPLFSVNQLNLRQEDFPAVNGKYLILSGLNNFQLLFDKINWQEEHEILDCVENAIRKSALSPFCCIDCNFICFTEDSCYLCLMTCRHLLSFENAENRMLSRDVGLDMWVHR